MIQAEEFHAREKSPCHRRRYRRLCTGVYLRKSGFDVEILEKHKIAGGLATAWKRQGYTFENCVHWLVGSKPGGDLNAMWREVFDIDKLSFHDDEAFQRIEADGKTLVIYKDVDRLERELMEKAPADAAAIRDMTGTIRKFSKMRMPGPEGGLSLIRAAFSMIPMMAAYSRVKKLTMSEYGARFTDPLLRRFFGSGLNDMSAMAILMSLAWMNNKNAGYPIGGSLALIDLIEENLPGPGRAHPFQGRGQDDHGRERQGLRGWSSRTGSASPPTRSFRPPTGTPRSSRCWTESTSAPSCGPPMIPTRCFLSYVQVSLGVADPFAGEPGFVDLALAEPLSDRSDDDDRTTSPSGSSTSIPRSRPAGKTAVVAFLGTYDYTYWENLRASDPDRYAAEKKRLADAVIAVLESRFPAARGKTEVVDVATPATVVRYTGNWKGSMEGWLVTPKTGIKALPDTLPGLKNFVMAGQWVNPGGGLPHGPDGRAYGGQEDLP